jgi:hypothetical protein
MLHHPLFGSPWNGWRVPGSAGPCRLRWLDAALEATLFAAAGTKQGHRRHAEPDWAELHRELKRKHVTLTMLWDEYIERCPEGYHYSRFCELYRGWASRLSVTMRQARYERALPHLLQLDADVITFECASNDGNGRIQSWGIPIECHKTFGCAAWIEFNGYSAASGKTSAVDVLSSSSGFAMTSIAAFRVLTQFSP